MKKTSKYTKQSNTIAPSDNTPDDATFLAQTKKTTLIKEDTLMVVDKDKTSLLPHGISTIEELQKIYQEQRIEKKLLDSKIYAQYLHEKEVTSITVSPDGKYVISGSKDTSIHVFDIREKRLFHAFNSTCKESINCVAVSSDSKFLVAGTSGGFIEGFRIKEKEPFFDFGKVHAKAVSSIAISPDNKSIITASWDKSIKVLNIESKQEIAHFSKAHKKEIFAVAITPNGRFIVSGCEDGSFKIFDLETKEEIFYLKNAHKEEITSVAISPDGKYLITGSNDKSIKMFDFKTRKLLHHFEDVHSGEVYSVAFSSNGRYIISGSNDDTIKIFDAEKKHQIHHIKDAHKEGVSTVAMSIDRRYIISGSNDKSVKIFCLEKKEDPINIKNAHSDWILSVAASPDGQYVLSGGRDSSIKVFDLESQKQIEHFKDIHEDWISSIAVTPDSQYVVSGSSDEKIKIHEIKGGKCVYDSQDKIQGSVFSVAISSDGKFVVCGTGSSSIAVLHIKNDDGTYNFTQPKISLFNNAHEESVTSVTVSPDNQYIISGSEDKSIKIFDISSLKPIGHLRDAHEGFIHSVAVSPNGKLIASGSKDNSIKIFDMETKLLVCHFQEAHQGEIYSVTFSPDSKHVVSGSEDRLIKIFNILTQQQIQQFQASDLSITSVVFSLDGKFIISGSKDQCIKIFDVASSPQINFFQDLHQEKITTFALSSKGKFLVSGSADKYVKMTFLENKRTVQLEPPHELPITCVAISDDENYAVSASQDKSIKIFNLEEKEQMAHIPDAHSEDKDIISSVAITSDNKYIVSASFDMSIKFFDFTTQNLLHTIPSAHQRTSRYFTSASFSLEPITCLKIKSENQYIITASSDKSIKGFDLSTQKLVFNFKDAHEDTISSIAISPNNRFIVSGSVDKSIKVFDLLKQRQIQHFKNVHTEEITSVNMSPDNKFIVSCSKDKSIKTHNITTGEQICHIPNAHSDEISAVCFSHDGLFIYSASADKSIRGFKTKHHVSNFDPLHSGHEIFYCIFSPLVHLIPPIVYEGLTTNTVLNSVDDFLLQKDLTGPLMTSIAIKSNFFILPYAWNILHISAIQNNHAFIKAMPSYFDFKVNFLLDYYHKTPLHYLVAHSKIDYISVNIMLAYICDYLQDCFNKNIYEFHQILQSLTPLFALILLKSELKLKEKFLNLAFQASPAPYNTEIPIFGEPKLSSACLSKAPVLTPQVQNTLWQEEGEEQVNFVSSFLHLDYNVISPDMQRVIRCLKEQKNEEVFKTDLISKLIDHLWDQSTFVLRMNFIIYSVFIIALSVYICLQDRSLPYEIVILVILGVFFMGEVLQILDLRKKYIKDPWNWLDITHLFLTTAFIIRRMVLDDDDLARKWIATIVIMLGYLRWVSYLRIFQSTRNLIQVIITVMKDMLSFIIIIALIIIGFSVIFLAFDRGQAYGVYLFNAYNVLYGPIDDNDTDEETPFNFSQKLLMCIIAFLLNVILLNLLISIMGDSYAKVLEKRDKTDSLTRLDMILEATASMKVFHKKHVAEKSYLVYCLSLEKEEDEVRQEDELEEKVTSIKRLLKKNEKRVEVIKEMTEQKINKLEQDVKENHDELKQKIQTNSELLKQMMETLTELKKNSNR